jgi:GTP pyrophosphokinase
VVSISLVTEGEMKVWAAQYRSEFPAFESCVAKLEGLIRDLLDGAGIDVVAVEARAKHPESFERKVDAKGAGYERPLEDITDLIGVRVIAYYLEDVVRISEIIEKEFVVDEENSIDKLDDLASNGFGYRSVHYVISLAAQRANLAEWSFFNGRKAEIQVRTATQHAWAAVEHKLNYKRTTEAPRDLRRRLMRLSALFELADDQFSAVKGELEAVEARYNSDVRGGNLDLPIDTASLEAFLGASEAVNRIVDLSTEQGLGVGSEEEESFRERYDRDLRDLSLLLEYLELETIAELDEMVRDSSHDPSNIELLADSFQGDFERWGSAADLLTVLIGHYAEVPIAVFELIYDPSVYEVIREKLLPLYE